MSELKEAVVKNPRSLQSLSIAACVLQTNEHIRMVQFDFNDGIVTNHNGKIAIQLKNKQQLRQNVLNFINDKTISKIIQQKY